MTKTKPDDAKTDLDRGLTVKREELKQLTVKTGLRAGVATTQAGPCSGCHCGMSQ
jgi:hypothetical protein